MSGFLDGLLGFFDPDMRDLRRLRLLPRHTVLSAPHGQPVRLVGTVHRFDGDLTAPLLGGPERLLGGPRPAAAERAAQRALFEQMVACGIRTIIDPMTSPSPSTLS